MAGGVGHGRTRRLYALSVNGRNLTARIPVDMLGPVRITEALGSPAQLEFSVYDPSANISLFPLLSWVTLTRVGFMHFGGFLARVELEQLPLGRGWRCTALGYDAILDRRTVPHYKSRHDVGGRIRRIDSDRQMILTLVNHHGAQLVAYRDQVDETNAAMGIVDIEGATLRGAIEQVADVATTLAPETNRSFYVDHYRRLHYYAGSEGLNAPYDIGDGTGGTIMVENLSATYDASDVRHRVYVQGTGAQGTGWVDPGVHRVGTALFDDIIDVGKDSSSVAKRNAYGRAFVRANSREDSFRFTILGSYHGWRLGQTVTITDARLGLDHAQKTLVELVTDFGNATGSGTAGSAVISYEIGLEKVRASHYRGPRRRRRRRHRG